jgi:hypothetical protein
MQASSKFSLLVFGPLLVMLLLPLAYLFPMTLFDIAAVSSSINPNKASETARHWTWVVGPVLVAAFIFIMGRLCYGWLTRPGARRAAWVFLWGFFSLMSLVAIWYAAIVLRSLLPTDAPLNTLKDLTSIAVLLALVSQPGVLGWLFAVSRIWNRFDRNQPGSASTHPPDLAEVSAVRY